MLNRVLGMCGYKDKVFVYSEYVVHMLENGYVRVFNGTGSLIGETFISDVEKRGLVCIDDRSQECYGRIQFINNIHGFPMREVFLVEEVRWSKLGFNKSAYSAQYGERSLGYLPSIISQNADTSDISWMALCNTEKTGPEYSKYTVDILFREERLYSVKREQRYEHRVHDVVRVGDKVYTLGWGSKGMSAHCIGKFEGGRFLEKKGNHRLMILGNKISDIGEEQLGAHMKEMDRVK
jgi:hypothetical protein